jgi:hypothetical protein
MRFGEGSELSKVVEQPSNLISRCLHLQFGEDASIVSHQGAGLQKCKAMNLKAVKPPTNGRGREPTVFWALDREQGRESQLARVLILMSDWCGFKPTPNQREPGRVDAAEHRRLNDSYQHRQPRSGRVAALLTRRPLMSATLAGQRKT